MFPQIFDAAGKAETSHSANPLRSHSQFMCSLISSEIYSSSGDRKMESHGVQTRRWFKGKDHDHFMKMYNKDFARKRSAFSSSDMDEVHAEYTRERELRDRRLEEEKWKVIFMLEVTLGDKKYEKIRLAAGDMAL